MQLGPDHYWRNLVWRSWCVHANIHFTCSHLLLLLHVSHSGWWLLFIDLFEEINIIWRQYDITIWTLAQNCNASTNDPLIVYPMNSFVLEWVFDEAVSIKSKCGTILYRKSVPIYQCIIFYFKSLEIRPRLYNPVKQWNILLTALTRIILTLKNKFNKLHASLHVFWKEIIYP